MSFAQRLINLHFTLGQGDFGQAGKDTISFSGLRCSADISKAGGISLSQLDLRVWGMPLDAMNKLTVLNKLIYAQQRFNVVTVEAGDSESGTAVCFRGTIQEAWADGSSAPDIMFHVSAFSGLFETINPIPPTSYSGGVDVSLALSGIAQQMGLGFENSGVSGHIENPYWPGSLGSQLKAICDAAHVEYYIDGVKQVLAAWPKGKARSGAPILVSKSTGMAGYPAFTQNGVQVRTLFNPSLAFGSTVQVKSEHFTAANNTWAIVAISHNLDSNVPGGQWFTDMQCSLLGQEAAIID